MRWPASPFRLARGTGPRERLPRTVALYVVVRRIMELRGIYPRRSAPQKAENFGAWETSACPVEPAREAMKDHRDPGQKRGKGV